MCRLVKGGMKFRMDNVINGYGRKEIDSKIYRPSIAKEHVL